MNLYEIDVRINQILNDAYNSEDGILTEEQEAELLDLEENKARIAEWLAKKSLNVRSDIAALTTEINRLGEMKNRLKKQDDNIVKIIDRVAGGQNMDFGVAKYTYRKSNAVIIDDEKLITNYLKFEHPECVKTTTEINKALLKKVMKNNDVPYCHLEERRKGSLK